MGKRLSRQRAKRTARPPCGGRDGAAVGAADIVVAHGCADAARDDAHAAEASGSARARQLRLRRKCRALSRCRERRTCCSPTSAVPFFSVVLPTYSSEPYLAAALGDLQDQLFTDWEAIVVNDCSPDGSLSIAQQFAAADARIRVVSHEANRGLSAARNTGFAAAQGRYVWFPDPDDRYDFTFLQSVYNSLQQHEAPVVMVGHVEEFYDAGGKVERVQEFTFSQESAHLGKNQAA